MSDASVPAAERINHEAVPVFWFCTLEDALEAGDVAAAAECQRRLAAMGYHLQIGALNPAPIAVEAAVTADQGGLRKKGGAS